MQVGEISLVLLARSGSEQKPPTVEYFAWWKEGTCGRIASADEKNKVKSIVPVGSQKYPIDLDLARSAIIWPRTGIPVVRAKPADRPTIPDSVARIKALIVFALCLKHDGVTDVTFTSTVGSDCCEICQASLSPFSSAESSDDSLLHCPICLMCMHQSCCQNVLVPVAKQLQVVQERSRSRASRELSKPAQSATPKPKPKPAPIKLPVGPVGQSQLSNRLQMFGQSVDVTDFPEVQGHLDLPPVLAEVCRRGHGPTWLVRSEACK